MPTLDERVAALVSPKEAPVSYSAQDLPIPPGTPEPTGIPAIGETYPAPTESIPAIGATYAATDPGEPVPQSFADVKPGQTYDPLKDFSADGIADLAISDPDNFDPVNAIRQRKDLLNNREVELKVAQALNKLQARADANPLADLTQGGALKTAGRVGSFLWDAAKGFSKRIWSGAQAAGTALVGEPLEVLATGGGRETATLMRAQAARQAGETIAASEHAIMGGLLSGEKAVHWLRRTTGVEKPRAEYTDEEKIRELHQKIGDADILDKISQGKGPLLGATEESRAKTEDLAKAGFPIRPEEVTAMAVGDPFAWEGMGAVFGGAGKIVKLATPRFATVAGARAMAGLSQAAPKVAGGLVQAVGATGEVAAKTVEKTAPVAGVIGGAYSGFAHFGAPGLVGGIALGEKAGERIAVGAAKAGTAAKAVTEAGKALRAGGAMPGAYTQLTKDVFESAPGAAWAVAKGAMFDLGYAAVATETPQERQGIGFGVGLAALGAGRGLARRAISGQIIGPRPWGASARGTVSRTLGSAETAQSTITMSPGQQERLGVWRGMANRINPLADVYFIPPPEAGAPGPDPILPVLKELGRPETDANTDALRTSFTDKNKVARKVVILRSLDAAPHDVVGHVMEDVVGEAANQELDRITREDYSDQEWTGFTDYYAKLLNNEEPLPAGVSAGDFILGRTNFGGNSLLEKARAIVEQRLIDGGKTATPDEINQLAVEQAKTTELTPEEKQVMADRYIARELRAENAAAWFGHTGPAMQEGRQFPEVMARAAAKIITALGGEPLEGFSRLGAPLKGETIRAIGEAARKVVGVKKVVAPKGKPSVEAATPEGRARGIAASAPDTILPGAAKSQREILGVVAEAIAAGNGVNIEYRSAPGEAPAAGTALGGITKAVGREVRRVLIEAARYLPEEAREMFQKTFVPERLRTTKDGRVQINGWAPQVLAANAQKLAEFLAVNPEFHPELFGAQGPYAVDAATKSFTVDGWRSLLDDVQTFSANQAAGHTGSGKPLVVPAAVAGKDFFAPPVKSPPVVLDQGRADVINALFGLGIQRTGAIAKEGVLPLNLAGQKISAVTEPGRVSVEPGPAFGTAGEKSAERAKALGITGEFVREVNPFRSELNAQEGAPSFIEARQWINAEHIADIEPAAEQPQVRGNTLTLAAGFSPRVSDISASEADYNKERDFAHSVLAGASKLSDYPYYADYQSTISSESKALRGVKNPLFIGGGPIPLSHILLSETLRVPVTSLDISSEATQLGNKIIATSGAGGRIITADATTYPGYGNHDAVIMALEAGVTPEQKIAILDNVANQVQPGTKILVRGSVEPGEFPGVSYPEARFTKTDDIPIFGGLSKTSVLEVKSVVKPGTGTQFQPNATDGFVDGEGKFLTRDEAEQRALDLGQVKQTYGGLESDRLAAAASQYSPFYSRLDKAIESLSAGEKEAKTGQQWKGWIARMAAGEAIPTQGKGTFRGGIAAEEIKWSGLADLEDGKRYTKQEIQEYIAQNKIQVTEVDKTRKIASEDIDRRRDSLAESMFGRPFEQLDEAYQTTIADEIDALRGGGETKFEKYQLPGGENYKEKLFTLPVTRPEETEIFSGPHWNEPNVIAHSRYNERSDSDSNPGLFLEEIQSDWHQEGRKEGYQSELTPFEKFRVARGTLETGLVPNAPFKTTWHEMVFRRMLHEAATLGKEWLGWTTGEQQAERYDLSKQVSEIGTVENADGTFGVNATTSQGVQTIGTAIPKEKLADYVGKDLADKIVNRQGVKEVGEPGYFQRFTGPDLKVGGEGMKGFYDKILVDYANKFGKKWGARVEDRQVPDRKEQVLRSRYIHPESGESVDEVVKVPPNTLTVHALPITQEMRKSVMETGVAQFAAKKKSPAQEEAEWMASLEKYNVKPKNEPQQNKWTLRPAGKELFSKAWILPNGEPEQLGASWHHDFINSNPEVRKQYNLPVTDSVEEIRKAALRKGFVRINYGVNDGTLTVEARQKDWDRQKDGVAELVRNNLGKVDNMRVFLFNDAVTKVTDHDARRLFDLPAAEKMENLPLISVPSEATTMSAQATSEAQFSAKQKQKQKQKKKEEIIPAQEFWVSKSGTVIDAPGGHYSTAFESGLIPKDWEPSLPEDPLVDFYPAVTAGGHLRGVNDASGLLLEGDIGVWEHLPRSQREAIEDLAFRAGKPVEYNGRPVAVGPELRSEQVQFMPSGNPRAIKAAAVWDDKGNLFEGTMHMNAYTKALEAGHSLSTPGQWTEGFVTAGGEKLDRKEAFKRAQEMEQLKKVSWGFGEEKDQRGFLPKELISEQTNMPGGQFSVTPEEFKSEDTLSEALKKPDWAILTWTKESLGAGTNKVNEERNRQLAAKLAEEGFDHEEVKGSYKGIDQGKNYIVTGIDPAKAVELGKEGDQQSVVVSDGLAYTDGTIQPVDHSKTVIGPTAEKLDFFSKVGDGPAFSQGWEDKKVPAQFAPAQQGTLFGEGEEKKPLSTALLASMGNRELAAHYPEAYVPSRVRNRKGELAEQRITSDHANSPLSKAAGSEDAAIKAYADKLVDEHNKHAEDPAYQSGMKWYSEFVPMLKQTFGKRSNLMAELLAATSPNTAPEVNFKFALDALMSYEAGKFTKQLAKFEQGAKMVESGAWKSWFAKEKNAGRTVAEESISAFLEQWINTHKLVLLQSNGKRYGMHSVAVLKVLARKWLTDTSGPKTHTFVSNLLGTGDEATIDVWADRTMRRLGYDSRERWRILPQNSTGVPDSDFFFSQRAFRQAAERLGIQPSALQGGLWFSEKKLWEKNGWGRLDLGDFRREIKRVPALTADIKRKLATKAAVPMELNLVEPRNRE